MKDFKIEDFWNRIKKLCNLMSITQREFSVVLGFPERTLERQIAIKSNPDLNQLVKMAEYFNVSLNYLITGEETQEYRDYQDMTQQLTENIKKRLDTKDFRLEKSLEARRNPQPDYDDSDGGLEEIKKLSSV